MTSTTSQYPYPHYTRTVRRANAFDIHEYQKSKILDVGDDTRGTLITPSPTVLQPDPSEKKVVSDQSNAIGVIDTYFYFNSMDRDGSSDLSTGEMKFSIASINNSNTIDKCVSIQIGSFYFPRIKNGPNVLDYFAFKRVYMLITSLTSSQYVMTSNGSAHWHFEFSVDNTNSIAALLTPINNIYVFKTPLLGLSQFNVKFYVPSGKNSSYKPIAIPSDTVNVQAIVPGTNPGQFTITDRNVYDLVDAEVIAGAFPYTPATSIAVYFDGFTSPSTTVNNAVATNDGWFVTRLVSLNVIEIAGLDLTPLAAPVSTNMRILKNVVQMAVRFTTVVNSNTNYLTPVHN